MNHKTDELKKPPLAMATLVAKGLFGGVFGVCAVLAILTSWEECAYYAEESYLFMMGLAFLLPVFFLGIIPNRASWANTYGHEKRFWAMDRADQIRRRCSGKWALAAGTVMIVFYLAFFRLLVWMVLLGGIVLVGYGVIELLSIRQDIEAIDEDAFVVRNLVLDRKHTRTKDRHKTYYLCFTDGKSYWKRHFSREEYNSVKVGEVRQAVFYEEEPEPMMFILNTDRTKV